MRRGQIGLQLALLIVVLLAGITAAVDLRRLETPEGTARTWAEATVFGDCPTHLALSVRAPDDLDPRVPEELCEALRSRSLAARTSAPRTSVVTRLVSQSGTTAQAEATVDAATGRTVARVGLVRRGDQWRVVRDAEACRVGCG